MYVVYLVHFLHIFFKNSLLTYAVLNTNVS